MNTRQKQFSLAGVSLKKAISYQFSSIDILAEGNKLARVVGTDAGKPAVTIETVTFVPQIAPRANGDNRALAASGTRQNATAFGQMMAGVVIMLIAAAIGVTPEVVTNLPAVAAVAAQVIAPLVALIGIYFFYIAGTILNAFAKEKQRSVFAHIARYLKDSKTIETTPAFDNLPVFVKASIMAHEQAHKQGRGELDATWAQLAHLFGAKLDLVKIATQMAAVVGAAYAMPWVHGQAALIGSVATLGFWMLTGMAFMLAVALIAKNSINLMHGRNVVWWYSLEGKVHDDKAEAFALRSVFDREFQTKHYGIVKSVKDVVSVSTWVAIAGLLVVAMTGVPIGASLEAYGKAVLSAAGLGLVVRLMVSAAWWFFWDHAWRNMKFVDFVEDYYRQGDAHAYAKAIAAEKEIFAQELTKGDVWQYDYKAWVIKKSLTHPVESGAVRFIMGRGLMLVVSSVITTTLMTYFVPGLYTGDSVFSLVLSSAHAKIMENTFDIALLPYAIDKVAHTAIVVYLLRFLDARRLYHGVAGNRNVEDLYQAFRSAKDPAVVARIKKMMTSGKVYAGLRPNLKIMLAEGLQLGADEVKPVAIKPWAVLATPVFIATLPLWVALYPFNPRNRFLSFASKEGMKFCESFVYMYTISAEIEGVLKGSAYLAEHPIFGAIGAPIEKIAQACESQHGLISLGDAVNQVVKESTGVDMRMYLYANVLGGTCSIENIEMRARIGEMERKITEPQVLEMLKRVRKDYWDRAARDAEEKDVWLRAIIRLLDQALKAQDALAPERDPASSNPPLSREEGNNLQNRLRQDINSFAVVDDQPKIKGALNLIAQSGDAQLIKFTHQMETRAGPLDAILRVSNP